MHLINNIRFTISVSLLTLSYLTVLFAGAIMKLADIVGGVDLPVLSVQDAWQMYKDEIELIKQGWL